MAARRPARVAGDVTALPTADPSGRPPYHRTRDHARALAAVERILIVRPTAPTQIRDRGYLLARLGRAQEAVAQLETYLTFAPAARDVQRVEALVHELKNGKAGGTR